MSEQELITLATEWICPNTKIATNVIEQRMINNLVRFGHAVLAAQANSASPRSFVVENGETKQVSAGDSPSH